MGNRMDQASIVVVRGGKAYKKGPAQEKKKWSSSYTPSTYNMYIQRKKENKTHHFSLLEKKKWEEGERVEEFKKSFPKKWICVVCAVWIHLFGDEGGGKKTC